MTLALLALVLAQESAEPVHADPGWARPGAAAGFVLSAVPLGLAVGAVVMLWKKDGTGRDALMVAAGLSAPVAGLLPTFAGRSAVLDDEQARGPRIMRIIGWVLCIYGAVSFLSSVAIGALYRAVAGGLHWTFGDGTVGNVIATVDTLLDGAICSAGVLLLSFGASTAAKRASVAVVPVPGGAAVALAGSF